MSVGYYAPVPFFDGPDAGQVGDNRIAQIEAARKTAIGLTEYGDLVYQIEENVNYWAVEPLDNQYGVSIGTTRNEYFIEAGTILRGKNWSFLQWPTRWVEFSTSIEWKAGLRVGPIDNHRNPTDSGVFWPPTVAEDIRAFDRLAIEAAFAARWVIENLDLPENDMKGRFIESSREDYWYEWLCQGQVDLLSGRSICSGNEFVEEALRQFAQGETDSARQAREKEELRMATSPFAVLKNLKLK